MVVQWDLVLTNLYVLSSSVSQNIFFVPAMGKYMKTKNLDTINET